MKVLLLLVSLAFAWGDESVVSVPGLGVMQGVVYDDHREFLGIPFGEAPVGNLRWKDPVPKTPWSGVLDATTWKDGCPQICTTPYHTCPLSFSENCLYLHVYTPRVEKIPSGGLPVMFWIHGGNFQQGGGGAPLYNASYFSINYPVIMVSTNYRVGALGFLASDTTGDELQGSYGFKDQQLALTWVQKYIRSLGGDPNQVTIAGQSAGGTSVACHMISPVSAPLFQRAIMQSDPSTLAMKSREQAAATTRVFAFELGCPPNNIACMRSKSINEVIAAQKVAEMRPNVTDMIWVFYPWTPVLNETLLPGQPVEAFMTQAPYLQKKPMIAGVDLEDAWPFIYGAFPNPVDETQYRRYLADIFHGSTPIALDTYPPDPNADDQRPTMAFAGTDYVFWCPNRAMMHGLGKMADTYMYRFDQVLSNPNSWQPNDMVCAGHVCHASELFYLFHSWTYDNSGFTVTPEEQLLADSLTAYWLNFVISGNPNTPSPPPFPNQNFIHWPKFEPSANTVLVFNATFTYVDNWHGEQCDLMDVLGTTPYLQPY